MKFSILAAMTARGMEIRDDRFRYRFVGDELHVARLAGFDRWANSLDFVYSIPKTQKSFDRMMSGMRKIADRQETGEPTEIARISST